MSDEEILATVVGDSTESESVCSDEEDEGEGEKLVSTKEAAQCFKKCLSWMESQNDIDPVQLMQLKRMMDFAMQRNCIISLYLYCMQFAVVKRYCKSFGEI